MRLLAVVALAACASSATGCGLDMSGLGPPISKEGGVSVAGDAATADGSMPGDDGGSGGGDDAAPGEAGPVVTCATGLPPGWSVVVYEPSRGACPAGYGASHDAFAGATAGTGSCACPCTVTTQPTCMQGMLSTQFEQSSGGAGQCGSPGTTLSINGSGCTPMSAGGGQLDQGFSAEPVGPGGGGACTVTLSANPGLVTAGFSACIVASGDIPCPSGPFGTRSRIDDDEILVCPACGSCSVSSSCGAAQVKFFGDSQCGGQVVATLACNGSCVPTGAATQHVSGYEYMAQPQATCQGSAAGAPTFNPVQPHTVCCR